MGNICGISTDLKGDELMKMLIGKAREYRLLADSHRESAICIEKYIETKKIACPKCGGTIGFNAFNMPRCIVCRRWFTIKLVEDEYQTDIKEEQLDV